MFEIEGVAGRGSGRLDALTRVVDDLAAADPRDVALGDLVADLATLHAQQQRLQAVFARMARVSDSDGGHHLAGYATTGAMLTDALRLSPGQGQAIVKVSRTLHTTFTATRDALAAGEISWAHASAIARAARKLPRSRLAEAQPLLLEVAREGSAAMVRAAVDRMAELLDPEHEDERLRDEYERRYLDVSRTLDGWWAVDGHLPPDVGQRLSAAIEQFAAPTAPDDTRTAKQRQADAVGEMADAALDGQTSGVAAVSVTVDAERMDGAGATWDPLGLPTGRSAFDLAVCQSRLTLVVAEKAGIGWKPLAVGMLSRFATPAQRAALAVRDGGCVYRGCTRPARRTHAHHVIDWRDGGPTDIENLVLLCAYHHRMVHLGRAVVVDDPDIPGRRMAVPAGRHRSTAA